MIYLMTAFSTSMLDASYKWKIDFIPISEEEVRNEVFQSAVGHVSTAEILSQRLRKPIEAERIFLNFKKDFILIVASIQTNRRLQEGEILSKEEISKLPITYWKVIGKIQK